MSSSLRVIDADGHVEENLDTFSDKYLDPAFRSLRPRVTAVDGLVYWVIDEQLYPRRVGTRLSQSRHTDKLQRPARGAYARQNRQHRQHGTERSHRPPYRDG